MPAPTLTPTAATGGKSVPLAMVSVPDLRRHRRGDLEANLDAAGFHGEFVADLLSAILTHERCGAHLYRTAAQLTANPVLAARYRHFGDETVEHAEILETLISSLGGDPQYVSPSARAVESTDVAIHQATFLATGSIEPVTAEVVLLQAVILAETVDHGNWELLGDLAGSAPEGQVRDELAAAVERVLADEDAHLMWARTTWSRIVRRQSESSAVADATTTVEAAVARVASWFADEAPGGHTS